MVSLREVCYRGNRKGEGGAAGRRGSRGKGGFIFWARNHVLNFKSKISPAGSGWALKPGGAGWRAHGAAVLMPRSGANRLRKSEAGKSDSLPSDSSYQGHGEEKGAGGVLRSQKGTGATARTRLGKDAPANLSRAGGLPSPVSCRGHRSEWVEVAGGTRTGRCLKPEEGSLQIQALPTAPEVAFSYPRVGATFVGHLTSAKTRH